MTAHVKSYYFKEGNVEPSPTTFQPHENTCYLATLEPKQTHMPKPITTTLFFGGKTLRDLWSLVLLLSQSSY